MGPVQVQRIGVYARSGIVSGKTRCGRLGGADPVVRLHVLAGSPAAGQRQRHRVFRRGVERAGNAEVHSLTVVSLRNRDLSLQLHVKPVSYPVPQPRHNDG